MPADTAHQVDEVRQRIAETCREENRPEDSVLLLLVSKRQPLERLEAAYAAGYRHFGENYVQELLRRKEAMPPDIHWHMIGHLQRNKAKQAAGAATMVHAVDSARLARALAKARNESAASSPLPVLLEVNIAEEPAKAGVAPDALERLLEEVRPLPGLSVDGLMAPPVSGRKWFAALRNLRDRLSATTGLPLEHLSMGMSNDYTEAVREGSTIVRVGSAVFGQRVS